MAIQRDSVLTIWRPALRAVKRVRGQVGRKEGDGVQSDLLGRLNCFAEANVIVLLHCGAAANGNAGTNPAKRVHAASQPGKAIRYPANAVVDCAWPVERYDDV